MQRACEARWRSPVEGAASRGGAGQDRNAIGTCHRTPGGAAVTKFEPVLALPHGLRHGLQRLRAALHSRRGRVVLVGAALGGLTVGLVVAELRTSRFQARALTAVARAMTFELGEDEIWVPGIASPGGPYDRRLGYSKLQTLTDTLKAHGYVVEGAARVSPNFHAAQAWGLFPAFQEKTQAGLRVVDRDGHTIYQMWLFRLSGGSFRLSWRDGGVKLTRYRRAAGPPDARHGVHRDAAGVGGSRLESGPRPSTGYGNVEISNEMRDSHIPTATSSGSIHFHVRVLDS